MRYEAGGSTPGFDALRRIAAALGLELVVELRARRGLQHERTAADDLQAQGGREQGPISGKSHADST